MTMTIRWIKSFNEIWKDYNTKIKPIQTRGQPILNDFITKYNLCISKSLNIQDKKNRIYTTLIGCDIKGNIKNKGTGAGGAKTNKNGLSYEDMTVIKESDRYKYTDSLKVKTKMIQRVIIDGELHIKIKKAELKLYMNENKKYNTESEKASQPDECYINETDKTNPILFIIEKKFQNGSGSVCEKIQSPDFKLWQYGRTFPGYEIVYIYCLSSWFNENCKAELEYLEYKNIPVFWGNDPEYKTKITHFITSYKLVANNNLGGD